MSDPHHVLGVPADATQEEITAAYHRLARRYHPDAGTDGGEPDRFREVVAAYSALRARQPPAPAPTPRERGPELRVGPVRYHGPPRR
jgi:curved DNA-binding protein CbpA